MLDAIKRCTKVREDVELVVVAVVVVVDVVAVVVVTVSATISASIIVVCERTK